MASILVTVQLAGQEVNVSRLWTGAKIIHVKMEEDVLSGEQVFTVSVQKAGLAKYVMFAVCHVKQQHVWTVWLVTDFAKMEDSVVTLETAMNVSALKDIMEAIAKLK
jgi:hypothetical protein